MLQKLPIGIQDFDELRTNNYLYIDKTEILHRLITQGKYYFLSRPRRFGKSLLISTLTSIFEGEKELFEGLWIENKIEWKKHPVIRIDFTGNSVKELGLSVAIRRMIDIHATKYGIELTQEDNRGRMGELVIQLHEKTKMQAAVLIDEYDKPIIDNLENIEQAEENRDILKDFYGVLKPLDPHLKFVFLTGVTKFSKIAIFSDLNNLNDITTHQRYSTMLGLTKEEINHSFSDRIPETCEKLSLTQKEFDEQLQFWYDGYSWDAENFLYNPFSILRFFDAQKFENYWFSTGTPTFLVNFIRDKGIDITDLEAYPVTGSFFDKFDIVNIDIISLLFQTGYLTMKEKNRYGFTILSYPNNEVKLSFSENLLESFSRRKQSELGKISLALIEALEANDMETFQAEINALFASIPYPIFIAEKERYYHSIIYLILKLLGVHIAVEVSTSRGRLDAVVQTTNFLYVIEFKMLPITANNAIAQIKEKGYADSYQTDSRKKFMIGISFDPEKKEIGEMKVERFY
ncbi:ATP-binding protein [bacterium]|nr:ATP-binding protein [bacterium]